MKRPTCNCIKEKLQSQFIKQITGVAPAQVIIVEAFIKLDNMADGGWKQINLQNNCCPQCGAPYEEVVNGL